MSTDLIDLANKYYEDRHMIESE